eukprot:737609-Amphidinium_carterae.1
MSTFVSTPNGPPLLIAPPAATCHDELYSLRIQDVSCKLSPIWQCGSGDKSPQHGHEPSDA